MDNNILKELNKKGVSQAEAAKQAGITRKHLNNIINGKTEPSVGIAARIARYLGKPIEQIFSFSP